jgi:hypothetical protein
MIRKIILLIQATIMIVSTGMVTAQEDLAENLKFFKSLFGN